MINRWTHTGVLPWEIDDIPDEWLAAYKALDGMQAARAARSKVEEYFTMAMRKHPTYRKH